MAHPLAKDHLRSHAGALLLRRPLGSRGRRASRKYPAQAKRLTAISTLSCPRSRIKFVFRAAFTRVHAQGSGASIKVEELRCRVHLVLADFRGVLLALFSEYCKVRPAAEA